MCNTTKREALCGVERVQPICPEVSILAQKKQQASCMKTEIDMFVACKRRH